MGQAAGWVEPFDQYFEGHILVFERGEAAGPHLCQQFGDRGIPCQVDPQHQRVDEEADQIIEGGIATTGDRKAHGDIGTGADLGQQYR